MPEEAAVENPCLTFGPRSRHAPEGHVWVCLACGKTSSDKYDGPPGSWWDASCFLNSELVPENLLEIMDGRVVHIRDESKLSRS